MREYDRPPAILSAFVAEDAERLAHPLDDPEQFAREFVEAVEPFKPMTKPCECKSRDWRTNAWEDFCIRRGVLLLTMAYAGKDGRKKVSQDRAVEMLHELRPAIPKDRTFGALRDVWKYRDRGHEIPAWSTREINAGDPPYLTRSDYLSLLVSMILDDEMRHEGRRARALAESPRGGK